MKLTLAFLVVCAALPAQVDVTVSSQGTEVVKMTTGYTPSGAVLLRLDACNEGDAVSISTSRIAASVIASQNFGIYGSGVVSDVLAVLQGKDIFSRAQKIVTSASNTATLLAALFKTFSPLTVGIVQSAPAIAQAILPAVGDPRDLAALGKQLMQDNSTYALGKKGSGNDCVTGLAVAMTSAVKISKVTVQ